MEPDDDFDLVLQDSDDDEEGTSTMVATRRKTSQKMRKKSWKIQNLESFLYIVMMVSSIPRHSFTIMGRVMTSTLVRRS